MNINNSNTNTKHKHLFFEDRRDIEQSLYDGLNFSQIASIIHKDPSTISKEVRKHSFIKLSNHKPKDEYGNVITSTCPKLSKAPYVCNPCPMRRRCRLDKHLYQASRAHKGYRELLVEARQGIPLNSQEFYSLDAIVKEGIQNGQHLYHILKANDLSVSISSVYRYIDQGYMSICALDLPRKVKFKRRKKPYTASIPKSIKQGRSFEDFSKALEDKLFSHWVEMDTVIGRIGGKVILTLHFTQSNFMFGILLEDKTASSVSQAFYNLKSTLEANPLSFKEFFPIILTDNGSEFSNVFAIENSLTGEKETSLYFARPMRSSDKARIEKNHTLLRDILPKGTSFDKLTQKQVNLIFSHINSVKRFKFGGKSAFEMFEFMYGTKMTSVLGIQKIPSTKVKQNTRLLES